MVPALARGDELRRGQRNGATSSQCLARVTNFDSACVRDSVRVLGLTITSDFDATGGDEREHVCAVGAPWCDNGDARALATAAVARPLHPDAGNAAQCAWFYAIALFGGGARHWDRTRRARRRCSAWSSAGVRSTRATARAAALRFAAHRARRELLGRVALRRCERERRYERVAGCDRERGRRYVIRRELRFKLLHTCNRGSQHRRLELRLELRHTCNCGCAGWRAAAWRLARGGGGGVDLSSSRTARGALVSTQKSKKVL